MKTFVLTMAAAGSLLVGGAAIANAQWSLSNGFRGEYDNTATAESGQYFSPGPRAEYVPPCGVVTVRERHDGKIVVRRVPRC